MATELKGFKCDKCHSVYKDRQQAINCENENHGNIHQAKITGAFNYAVRKLTGILKNKSNPSHVPTRIEVSFSGKTSDYGTYNLVQYGDE